MQFVPVVEARKEFVESIRNTTRDGSPERIALDTALEIIAELKQALEINNRVL